MHLTSWNCQGAFRKKAEVILKGKPDILVVQECEHTDKVSFAKSKRQPTDALWFGENEHKGLGVFSFGDYRLRVLEDHNTAIKLITPIAVTGGEIDFTLFAVWANNKNDPDGQYVEQVWKAIHHYDHLLSAGPVVLIGDFNSNTIWDRPRRVGNHSAVVAKLAEKNISSVYHRHHKQEHGKEKHPTFFLYRDKGKPYHLDYCFVSEELYGRLEKFEIGRFRKWIEFSDHLPLSVVFSS